MKVTTLIKILQPILWTHYNSRELEGGRGTWSFNPFIQKSYQYLVNRPRIAKISYQNFRYLRNMYQKQFDLKRLFELFDMLKHTDAVSKKTFAFLCAWPKERESFIFLYYSNLLHQPHQKYS